MTPIRPTILLGPGRSQTEAAMDDLAAGLLKWNLWVSFGWLDVKQRYRRAVLGPFWITISMAVLVVALGILYAGIFRQDVRSFLPYIGAGFVVWGFISTTITESTTVFILSQGMIKQGGIPLSFHIFRTIFRNAVIGAHNIVVMLLLYIWQPSLLSWNFFLIIPGLVLLLANLAWISIIVGALCLRFRDLPPIVTNLLQIAFFVSPIMYKTTALPPTLDVVVHINPLYYMIEVVRAPLLGMAPSLSTYLILLFLIFVGFTLTFQFYRIVRSRIPYWL